MDKSPDSPAKGETSKKPLALRGVKNGSPAEPPRGATNAPRPTTLRTPGASPRLSSAKSSGIKDTLTTKSSNGRSVASSPKKSSVSTDGDPSSPKKNSSKKISVGQRGDKALQEKAASPTKSAEGPQASAPCLAQGGEASFPSPGAGSASKTEVKPQLKDKTQCPRPERTASVPSKSVTTSSVPAKPMKASPVKRVQTLPSSPKPVNTVPLPAKSIKPVPAQVKTDSPSLTAKSTASALVKPSKSAPLQTKPAKSPSATAKPGNHAAVVPAKSARATSAPVKPLNTASVPRQSDKTPLTSVKSASAPAKPEKTPSTPVKPASVPTKAEKSQSPLAKPANKVSALPSKPLHAGSKLNKPMKNAPVPVKKLTTASVPIKPVNTMAVPCEAVPLGVSADKEGELVPQSPLKPLKYPDGTVINRSLNEQEETISEAVNTCAAPVTWPEDQLLESVNKPKESADSNLGFVRAAADTVIPPMEQTKLAITPLLVSEETVSAEEPEEPPMEQTPVDQPVEETLEISQMVVKFPLEAVKCAMRSHNSSSLQQPPSVSLNTAIDSIEESQRKSDELVELQEETVSCPPEFINISSENAGDLRPGNVDHSTTAMEPEETHVAPFGEAENITEQGMLLAETTTTATLKEEDEAHSMDQTKGVDECLRSTVDSVNTFEELTTTSCIFDPTKLAEKNLESTVEPVNYFEGFPGESTSGNTTGHSDQEATPQADTFKCQEQSGLFPDELIQPELSQLGGKLQFSVEEDMVFPGEPVNVLLMEGEGPLKGVVGFPVEPESHFADKAPSLLEPINHLNSEKELQVVEKVNNLEDVKPNGQSQILMEGLMSVEETESMENDVILPVQDKETEHSFAKSVRSTGEVDPSVVEIENVEELETVTFLEELVSANEIEKSRADIETGPEIDLKEGLLSEESDDSIPKLENVSEMESATSAGEEGKSIVRTECKVDVEADISAFERDRFTEHIENLVEMEPGTSVLKRKPVTPLEEGEASVENKPVTSVEIEPEKPFEDGPSDAKPDKSISETDCVAETEPVTERISSPVEPEGSPAEPTKTFSEIASTVLSPVQESEESVKEPKNTSELESKAAELNTIPVFPEISAEPSPTMEPAEPLEVPFIVQAEEHLDSVELTNPIHSVTEEKYLEHESMNDLAEQITAASCVDAEESDKEATDSVNTLTPQEVLTTPFVELVAQEPLISLTEPVDPSKDTDITVLESAHSLRCLVDAFSVDVPEPKCSTEMTDNRMDTSSTQGVSKSSLTDEHENVPHDPVAVLPAELTTMAVEPTVSSTVPATTTIDIPSLSLGPMVSELEGSLQVMPTEHPSKSDNAQPGELSNVAKCLQVSMDSRVSTKEGVGEPWVLVQREELDGYKEEEIEEKCKRPVSLNQESEEDDDNEKGKGDEEGETVASRCSTLSDPQLAGQSSSETSTPEELRTYEDSSSGVESHSDDVATSPPTTLTPDPDLGIHMGQEEGGETPAGTPAPQGKGTLHLLRDADNGGLSQGPAPTGVLTQSESGSEGYKREMPGINCPQDSSGARGQEQEEKAGAGGIQRGHSLAQPCDGLYTIYESERGHQERGPRGSELGLVEQIIGRTLLLAASEGGVRGGARGVELGRWAELLSPLDESRASITSVTSFSPEGDVSPQGDWTVVEVETFH